MNNIDTPEGKSATSSRCPQAPHRTNQQYHPSASPNNLPPPNNDHYHEGAPTRTISSPGTLQTTNPTEHIIHSIMPIRCGAWIGEVSQGEWYAFLSSNARFWPFSCARFLAFSSRSAAMSTAKGEEQKAASTAPLRETVASTIRLSPRGLRGRTSRLTNHGQGPRKNTCCMRVCTTTNNTRLIFLAKKQQWSFRSDSEDTSIAHTECHSNSY